MVGLTVCRKRGNVSISRAEEVFLKQKARNQWLQLGDQNNSFFHRVNSITFLCDEHERRVEYVDQMKVMAEEFYVNLLGTKHSHFTVESAARLRQLISPVISPVISPDVALLEREATAEEIVTQCLV
jgi:hypothetical protein